MRYNNLTLTDIEIGIDSIDCQIGATEELINLTNTVRAEQGYTDLVGLDNDVYYDFYLVCFPLIKEIKVIAICNNGEFDDYTDYVLPMTDEEKEVLALQLDNVLTEE